MSSREVLYLIEGMPFDGRCKVKDLHDMFLNLCRVRVINQYNKGCKLLRFCGVVSFVVVMKWVESNSVCRIIRVINKIRVWFVNYEYDFTQLDQVRSCYQLIKAMTNFQKYTSHQVYIFMGKKTFNSAKCRAAACTNDTYCTITQSNNKHSTHWPISALIGLLITFHVREL